MSAAIDAAAMPNREIEENETKDTKEETEEMPELEKFTGYKDVKDKKETAWEELGDAKAKVGDFWETGPGKSFLYEPKTQRDDTKTTKITHTMRYMALNLLLGNATQPDAIANLLKISTPEL